jgi:hypothetical protein
VASTAAVTMTVAMPVTMLVKAAPHSEKKSSRIEAALKVSRASYYVHNISMLYNNIFGGMMRYACFLAH